VREGFPVWNEAESNKIRARLITPHRALCSYILLGFDFPCPFSFLWHFSLTAKDEKVKVKHNHSIFETSCLKMITNTDDQR
jgi:hypothetical protein